MKSSSLKLATQKNIESRRTIAGLSMTYLLPSFVATLCSTIYISKKPDGPGTAVGTGFWIL